MAKTGELCKKFPGLFFYRQVSIMNHSFEKLVRKNYRFGRMCRQQIHAVPNGLCPLRPERGLFP